MREHFRYGFLVVGPKSEEVVSNTSTGYSSYDTKDSYVVSLPNSKLPPDKLYYQLLKGLRLPVNSPIELVITIDPSNKEESIQTLEEWVKRLNYPRYGHGKIDPRGIQILVVGDQNASKISDSELNQYVDKISQLRGGFITIKRVENTENLKDYFEEKTKYAVERKRQDENSDLEYHSRNLLQEIKQKFDINGDFFNRLFSTADKQRRELVLELTQFLSDNTKTLSQVIEKLAELGDRAQDDHVKKSGSRNLITGNLFFETCGFTKMVNEIITKYNQLIADEKNQVRLSGNTLKQ